MNTVAEKVPVEGLKFNFDEDTYVAVAVPVVTSTNVGYLTAFVVVSSVIDEPLPAEPATPWPP